MTTIAENIGALMGAITTKLGEVPSLKYEILDMRRQGQTLGGMIVVRHQDHDDFDAGMLWVGSAVPVSGGKRSAQPQEYFDNLLEVKSTVNVSPKYMFKWLEQGAPWEVNFRQAKPDAKVRVDALAEQVGKWAHVLMSVTPGHVVETAEKRRLAAEEAAKAAEAKRVAELKEQLKRAREEARERQTEQLKDSLLRDYPEFLYETTGRYYGEDPVKRGQRERVQAQAGFQLTAKTRTVQGTSVDDARAWFELDGSYAKPFSEGEIRAMLDALKLYRATTPEDEWLPRLPTGEEDAEVASTMSEDEEPEAPAELSAAILLAVPLPDTMD